MKITVADLLGNQIPTAYNDRLFWFASSTQWRTGDLRIDIDNTAGLVSLDPELATSMSLPTVDDLAKQSPAGKFASGTGPMLVSSGVLLWLNGRLAVTRRSHDARYDPGHWTTPAGRCDSTPRITAFKEAAEEIQVRQPDTGQIWIPREAHKSLQDKAKEYPTKLGFPPPITAPLVTVQTFLDDTQIEECQMWACFVAHCNTLELRLPLVAQLPFEPELSNPEYGTPALILSHTELRRRDLVPALAFFLEEVQQYEYE